MDIIDQDPFKLLKNAEETSTKAGKKIIHYILTHRSEMQYIPLSELSEACSVSDASISRFCHSLGYESYTDFKLAISRACSSPVLSVTPIAAPQAILMTDSIEEMAKKLLANELCAMQETLNALDEEKIRQTIEYINKAKSVYCFGQGASGILAKQAWARFSTISNRFRYIEDSHLQIGAASLFTPDDVLIAFCYSGATRDMQELLPIARANGAKIVLITHYEHNPASKFADIILISGSKEHVIQMGSISAKISILYLVDILVNEFCRENPEITSRQKEMTSQAVIRKHI